MYAVVAWLLIQVADTVLPALQLPEWTITFVIVLLILGFPLSMVLAWVFELTSEGLRHEKTTPSEIEIEESINSGNDFSSTRVSTDNATQRQRDEVDVKPCIAVLPFADMSQEKNQEWFSEGITEEILNGLAKIPQLKVIARTSSFALKDACLGVAEIGQKLNATHVLEGSIRSSGTRIRVSTQLGDTKDGAQVWSDQFNDELTDVFSVQEKIAAAISSALNIHLLPAHKKAQLNQQVNPAAFKKYIQGRQYLNLVQLQPAISYFEQAADLDPEFADSYGAMARTHNLYIFFNQASWATKKDIVESNLSKALGIDPAQREALAVRASNLFFIERKFQESINEFDRMIRLYPNDTTAVSLYRNVLQATGYQDYAIRVANRMVELDPLSPQAINYRGGVFLYRGEFDDAQRDFVEATNLGAKIAQSHANLAFLQHDSEGIDSQLDLIKAQLGENAYIGFKARSAFLGGSAESVHEILSHINTDEYLSHSEKAIHYFLKADRKGFLSEFREALNASEFYPFLRAHSALELIYFDNDLVNDHEYQNILKEVGLDTVSLGKIRIPELPF